jgi:hypothetical protein
VLRQGAFWTGLKAAEDRGHLLMNPEVAGSKTERPCSTCTAPNHAQRAEVVDQRSHTLGRKPQAVARLPPGDQECAARSPTDPGVTHVGLSRRRMVLGHDTPSSAAGPLWRRSPVDAAQHSRAPSSTTGRRGVATLLIHQPCQYRRRYDAAPWRIQINAQPAVDRDLERLRPRRTAHRRNGAGKRLSDRPSVHVVRDRQLPIKQPSTSASRRSAANNSIFDPNPRPLQ